MSRQPRTLTPSELEQIEAMGKLGLSFARVTSSIGAHRETLIAALDRQHCGHWMDKYFAPKPGYGGQAKRIRIKERVDMPMRKLKPEQIEAPLKVPGNAQTRWLTKSWGKAA